MKLPPVERAMANGLGMLGFGGVIRGRPSHLVHLAVQAPSISEREHTMTPLTCTSQRTARTALAGAALAVVLPLLLTGCGIVASPTDAQPSTPSQPSRSSSASPDASSTPSATQPSLPSAPSDEKTPEVGIDERPGYAAAENFVVGTFTRYSEPSSPDYAYGLVPDTEPGRGYARDFLVILADVRGTFRFLPGGTSSTDVAALDAQIQSYVDSVTETERKFLAGEDFGVTIKITNSDGSVYESDGSNRSND
jgi:hypothetical protein